MPHRFPDGLPAVLPATMAHLERRLPVPGEIMVRVNSRVEPDDLIGQCSVPGEPVLIDVAGALGMAPHELPRRLRRQLGERVGFRDLLARRRGRSLLAPLSGTLSDIDEATGFIMLTPDPMPASVAATVRGTVVDIEPAHAVTITTPAAVVQGAAGFGGEQWGVLRLLVTDPGDSITPEMIDGRSAFAIVIGGAAITADALRKAREEQVKGILVGSVDAEQLRDYWGEHFRGNWMQMLRTGVAPLADDGPTLVLTEGFGRHAMNRNTFELLTYYDRQEAHIDGTTRLGRLQRRPRMVIPLARVPDQQAPPAPGEELRPGTMVRLLDEPHLGLLGQVEQLHPQGRLPSGVRTATATVHLADGRSIEVAETALEITG